MNFLKDWWESRTGEFRFIFTSSIVFLFLLSVGALLGVVVGALLRG